MNKITKTTQAKLDQFKESKRQKQRRNPSSTDLHHQTRHTTLDHHRLIRHPIQQKSQLSSIC